MRFYQIQIHADLECQIQIQIPAADPENYERGGGGRHGGCLRQNQVLAVCTERSTGKSPPLSYHYGSEWGVGGGRAPGVPPLNPRLNTVHQIQIQIYMHVFVSHCKLKTNKSSNWYFYFQIEHSRTIQELLKFLVTASQVKLQGQNIMVFELYLIKYLKYRSQIQIQPSLKSQIQIQIRILSVFKYKYVFDPNPGYHINNVILDLVLTS